MSDTILAQNPAGPIATVVLNRPEKLNALTRPMWKRLGDVFEELWASESVRCIVIRGAGTRAFAPGNDQVEAEARATAERIADGAPLVARWHKKFARRLRDAKPLSAAEYEEGFACFGTGDFRIDYQAFLAKQMPQFKGS